MMNQNGNAERNEDDFAEDDNSIFYGISDPAPWALSLLSGLQHFLSMTISSMLIPHLLFNALCIPPDDPARADLVSGMFFTSGIINILQSAIGCRLPIMQATTACYLFPTFAVLSSPEWKCTFADHSVMSNTTSEISWQTRFNMVRGSMMAAALFEIIFGLTGLVGLLLRFITPPVITPVLTLLGLSVLEEALDYANGNWPIFVLTVGLLVVFTENLKKVYLPWFSYTRNEGFRRTKGIPIFQFFPVLLVLIVVWTVCIVLTTYDVISRNSKARTDLTAHFIESATWFRLPRPDQWGYPTISLVLTVGMIGSCLVEMATSVGNYYVCAKASGAPQPPVHAINRGIFIEGIGSFLDGLFGLGNGSESYSENVGIITITKIASRRVMYAAGSISILVGLFPKVGALVVAVPEPIIGGLLVVLFSSITTIGLANLHYMDLNSSRNLLVIGLPLFCGLAFPPWLERHKDFIQTGNAFGDDILTLFLSTGMFVGGFLGLILDNVIPGTPEERGIVKWNELQQSVDFATSDYDLPFGMSWIKKFSFLKFLPILPSFKKVHKCLDS